MGPREIKKLAPGCRAWKCPYPCACGRELCVLRAKVRCAVERSNAE